MIESQTAYFLIAIAIAGLITFLLRALPFAVLKKLRKSIFVKKLGMWMPVGIMLILAVTSTRDVVVARSDIWWAVPVSLFVTIAVHLLTKRNTSLSVLFGTVCYVLLVNFLA